MHNFSRARLLLESRVIAALGNDRQQKGKGKGGSKNEGQTQKPFLQGGGLGVHLSCNGTEEKAMNQAWAQGKEHTWSCFETEAKKLTFAKRFYSIEFWVLVVKRRGSPPHPCHGNSSPERQHSPQGREEECV